MTADQERAAQHVKAILHWASADYGERGSELRAAAAFLERQASELADLRMKLDTAYAVVIDLGGEVREPEIEEQRRLRADAARYRWFRKWWMNDDAPCQGFIHAETEEMLDAAIDAAKEQQA